MFEILPAFNGGALLLIVTAAAVYLGDKIARS